MSFKKVIFTTMAVMLASTTLVSCSNSPHKIDNENGNFVQPFSNLKPTETTTVKAFNNLPEGWKYEGSGQKITLANTNETCTISSLSTDNAYAGINQGDNSATGQAFTNFVADDAKMSNPALGNLVVEDTNLGKMDFATYEFSSTRNIPIAQDDSNDMKFEKTETRNFIAVRGFDTGIENKEVTAGRIAPAVIMVGRCTEQNDFNRDTMKEIFESATIGYVTKENNE